MKTNNFNDVTMIVTVFNRITGLRNLSDSDTRYSTLLNYSYKMFVIAFTGFSVYYSHLFGLVTLRLNLKVVVYVIMGFGCFFSFICIIVLSWYHSQEFSMLKRRIAVLEESLTKLGVVINHRNILIWTIGFNIATVLNWTIIIGYCIMISLRAEKQVFRMLLSQIVLNYMMNIGGLVMLDFMMYVWWLKFGFEQTNDLLKKFLVDGRQIKMEDLDNKMAEDKLARVIPTQRYLSKWISKYSTRRTRVIPLEKIPPVKHELQAVKRVQMIQEIRFIHLQLCRITKLVNNVFGMQLMVYTVVVVIYLSSILYYLYTIFVGSSSDTFQIRVFSLLPDPLYMWSKIILVTSICERAAKEANKVIVIIHECSIYDIDTELKDEVSQFSLQISLNQVGDTKCNLLPLNYSFIRQWISSMTTYLVIMIQWTQSSIDDETKHQNTTDSFI
ncbi:uncharacterized protein LOC143174389 [Nomia melanderi]|uniref:uncharacterized protein LOC143174389 n=1 Tax=Nomia melanderi TaxID=2448451 RepID=UPI003FCD6407